MIADWNAVPDAVWTAVNSLQIVAIVYIVIAVARLGERISKLEGRTEERNHQEERK